MYPRLSRGNALARLAELAELDGDIAAARERAAVSDPAAAPVATGPPPVPIEVVEHIATSVRDLARELNYPNALTRPRVSAFDVRCGELLHSQMQVVPADAASEGVWSFLTLVVLPDVALWRFPTGVPARFLGMPRNTFRRLWWRAYTLEGANDPGASEREPLGEDELVGIFERSSIAGNASLARAMTRAVRALSPEPGVPRSEVMRDLAKRVRRLLAYISVAVLDDRALDGIVARELELSVEAIRAQS